MAAYVLRRLALIVPTLIGIMIVNFVIVQLAPGGPIEQLIAELQGQGDVTQRFTDSGGEIGSASSNAGGSDGASSSYRGAEGLDPEFIAELEKLYGFDRPMHERFFSMMSSYLRLDFGESFFSDRPVFDLVAEKMPVSISLGLWSTLIVYAISIPMGVRKAVRDGSTFDVWTSAVVIVGYAIPSFLFALLLIILFAGGNYFDWFPLRGLSSENWEELSTWGKIKDYAWHMTLPVIAMVIGGFASLTMLTKNSFVDQIGQQYVLTARAKGLSQRRVLYGHVFRNAMLIVIAGFPAAFVSVFFTGSLLIETMFSLDGLGLLGYEAALKRDYPVIFGTLFVFTLLGLVMKLISDLTYVLIDPRIDFESREV